MTQISNRFQGGCKVLLLPAFMCLTIVLTVLLMATPAQARQLTKNELEIISDVNDYLNSFQHMQGHFVQVGPFGKFTSGRFFISRPGRVRFEYEPPSPLMIVADGTWVSIENRRLKTSEHYPLRITPLKIILAEEINLLKDADITHVYRDDTHITLTMHDKGAFDSGQITLVFQTEEMVLKEWIVVDGQGFRTRISISDIQTGIRQNPKLFFIKKPDFPESDR